MLLFITLNREDFSFVIHLDRQPRTSRRREAQTGSRARSGSRSERTLDAVEHSRTLMEWWPFLIFHRGGLRIKVINNNWPHVNYYASRPRRPNGKWRFLVWDAEAGVGRWPVGFEANTLKHVYRLKNAPVARLFVRLMRNPRFQRSFSRKRSDSSRARSCPRTSAIPSDVFMTASPPTSWRICRGTFQT